MQQQLNQLEERRCGYTMKAIKLKLCLIEESVSVAHFKIYTNLLEIGIVKSFIMNIHFHDFHLEHMDQKEQHTVAGSVNGKLCSFLTSNLKRKIFCGIESMYRV